jgi:cytohesin
MKLEGSGDSGALIDAIWARDLDTLTQLLDQGADLHVVARDKSGLLHKAAAVGDCAIVELLAERGADVSAKNDRGETPVCIALNKGFTAIAEILMRFGANADAWTVRSFGAPAK